ncbi:MAG: HEPN domain-containing protein [Deltaproteobacteria bacterium]|nr:HEPN domain-containing protein [Deltaproteobacteria bacterium]
MGSEKNLDIEKLKTFWVTEAEKALRFADHLVEKEDFSHALFFAHLALEKMLKGVCVNKLNDHAPPIRNLVRLARIAGLELDDKTENALIMITGLNIESRYPDFKKSFRKKCTQEFTIEQINEIKRVFKWLRSHLK